MKLWKLFLIVALVFTSSPAFAGENKGSVTIDRIIPVAPNQVIVEYTVDYRQGTDVFHLDQQVVVVNLTGSAGTNNNIVQADARAKVNAEFGPNTITDNNDMRCVGGFVD